MVTATLRLRGVETAWVEVDTERFNDVDGAMSAMEDHGPPLSILGGMGGLQSPSQGSRSVRHDEG